LSPLVSDTCPAEGLIAALEILYQDLPAPRRRRQIDLLMQSDDPAARSVQQGGLLICRRDEKIVGAMLTLPAPGRVMMAWMPRCARGTPGQDQQAIGESLLQRLTQSASTHAVRFIQLLTDELSASLRQAVQSAGYFHLTQLVYARRSVEPDEKVAPTPTDVEFVPYKPEFHTDLLRVLDESYRESLDCPELTGLRTLDDVFASHRGHGEFMAERWLLARQSNQWVGCLLLSAGPSDRAIEISYVAVLPHARGKGLGKIFTREAIRRAHAEGFEAVVLAVDGRNMPALAMYEDEGFIPWDIREIYLLVLDPADGRMVR
jgi:mycothiol synthase